MSFASEFIGCHGNCKNGCHDLECLMFSLEFIMEKMKICITSKTETVDIF